MSSSAVGLPQALERAATALSEWAEVIRPANGDPARLAEDLAGDGAERVLVWLLENEPEDGAELAEAWAEGPGPGADALLGIAPEGLPKTARKALRRARHRLRSRGVEVPEAPAPGVVATLPPIEDELDGALISGLDPSGARVAYLVESNPSGGARLFEVTLDENRGVVEFEVYTAGRSKVRKFLREFARRDRFPAVDAPPEAVRALIQRIAGEQPEGRPLPRAFSTWRSRVAAPANGAQTPGERVREELGPPAASEARELLARVIALIRERELGPWPPPGDVLRQAAETLAEIAKGQIIVSGAARKEQIEGAIALAVTAAFGEPGARRAAQRFEESAYVLWKQERTADARACLAAAEAFRAGEPQANPVARALIEVVLSPVLPGDEEPAPEEESLLVKR